MSVIETPQPLEGLEVGIFVRDKFQRIWKITKKLDALNLYNTRHQNLSGMIRFSGECISETFSEHQRGVWFGNGYIYSGPGPANHNKDIGEVLSKEKYPEYYL